MKLEIITPLVINDNVFAPYLKSYIHMTWYKTRTRIISVFCALNVEGKQQVFNPIKK